MVSKKENADIWRNSINISLFEIENESNRRLSKFQMEAALQEFNCMPTTFKTFLRIFPTTNL